MPKNHKESYYSNYSPLDVLALAIRVYDKQGFIRSGEGYVDINHEEGTQTVINDNKTEVTNLLVTTFVQKMMNYN